MRVNRDPLYWAAWLALLTAVAFFSRSYIPIDETRYLSVAWEMWQRGDFLVPFKNGAPYSHKPPLLFWLMHLGWAVTGVNDWWPRLISPLLSFLALFQVRRLAIELWPQRLETARLAPWILLGSLLWALYSETIMFDLLLACCTLMGILALVRASRGQAYAWPLYALATGLGVLAKGPAILLHLLPAALLAPWWCSRCVVPWRRWYADCFLALFAGVAIALLWAIPAGLMGGEAYRHAIFWGQTANRMVESFAHRRPFWWYVPLLPLLLYPWFVWPAFWRGLKHASATRDDGLRLTLAWLLPAFLAFSLVSGKQVHYLLPEFPAFALLAGMVLADIKNPTRPWLPALLLAMLGLLVLALQHLPLPESAKALHQVPVWGGLGFLLLALWTLLQTDTPARLVGKLAATALATMMGLHLVLIRAIADAYDVRPMAAVIAQIQAQSREVANVGEYHDQYQFAGRLLHPVPEIAQGEAARNWLTQHPNGAAVMYFPRQMDLTPYHPRFSHSYRGQQSALFDAPSALAIIDQAEMPK